MFKFFLTVFIGLAATVVWLSIQISPDVALMFLIVVLAAALIFLGIGIASTIQRNTLENISSYAERDAMADRYRQQTLLQQSRNEGVALKSQSKMLTAQSRQLPSQPTFDQWPVDADSQHFEEWE